MGKKKKKNTKESGEESETKHSPNTVFVSNFPRSFTNSQLEETFSDVGPIRRCFLVTQKGSSEHRGFGFVQFAIKEDANRAIELKDGSSVSGQKIFVKHAMSRAPLDQRRAKAAQVVESDGAAKTENDTTRVDKYASKLTEAVKHLKPRKPVKLSSELVDEENCSEKQRVARTVIFGGLLDDAMAEEVHRLAREVGNACSVTYPLPKEDLEKNGLAQDGCRSDVSAILYTSVKEARLSVRMLHQKEIRGGIVWARQLGGEGSKTQKWKLIVRNLPFKSKGFAFVKFTCKRDAENAIKQFNLQKYGKRPMAVDWAVSKKMYSSGAIGSVPPEEGHQNESDGSSDDTEDDENDDDVDGASDNSDPFEKNDMPTEGDFDAEADMARKVLNSITLSSKGTSTIDVDDSVVPMGTQKPNSDETVILPKSNSSVQENMSGFTVPEKSGKSDSADVRKAAIDDDDLQRTVFISNLPFDADNEEVKQRFSVFGEVKSFVPVLHQVTKRPRGTGFLKFKTEDAAIAAVSAANLASGLGILLKGRQLTVLKALDKNSAHNKEMEKAKNEDNDHRNLYLAKEGVILEGTPASEGVSASDMDKRKALHEKKMTKLRSPNFHVSRNRLVVYNLPHSVTEKKLKKLCIDAVISRATKQKPVIRQIKFLQSTKTGKVTKNHSRGVAFIEFTEHQHALVALRVLNNNPETFGPEHRPIVEFAVDNVQKLKFRKAKLHAQQQDNNADSKDMQDNIESHAPNDIPGEKENFRKWKSRADNRAMKTSEPNETEVEILVSEGTSSEKISTKKRKRNTGSDKRKTATKEKFDGAKQKVKDSVDKQNHHQVRKPDVGDSVKGELMGKITRKSQPLEEAGLRLQKRKPLSQGKQQEGEENSKRRKRLKKNKDPVGRDVVDKLDMLIEQYRSKFSKRTSEKPDDEKQANKPRKRWFQS
eukprot:XP_015570722.1 RNA-binding protein 28 [Ricinus communis]